MPSASATVTTPAPGDAMTCDGLQKQYEAVIAQGGTCKQDTDCSHFRNGYIAAHTCGLGITDTASVTQLDALTQKMAALKCTEVRAICPHIVKRPACQAGRCG